MKNIKTYIIIFQIGLLVSGITAFWIPEGVQIVYTSSLYAQLPIAEWLESVHIGTQLIASEHAFFLYGTDWLAFAHVLFAILFYGLYKDPIRNIWLVEFGLIACALIIPLALIAGHVREIPMLWRILDCSFGIIGASVLIPVYRSIKNTIKQHQPSNIYE